MPREEIQIAPEGATPALQGRAAVPAAAPPPMPVPEAAQDRERSPWAHVTVTGGPDAAFVVQHSRLGAYLCRGDVFRAREVPGIDLGRLVWLGACRPARADEEGQRHVTPAETPAPSLERQIGEQQDEVRRLRSENERLREEAQARRPLVNPPAPPAPPALGQVMAQKDAVIAALQAQVESLTAAQSVRRRGGAS
jgi:hypothetical protein